MHKGLLIYLSIFIGLSLTIGGGYIAIDNLVHPKGLLFEGIVGAAIGITLLLIIMLAKTFGDIVLVFTKILEQTTELNEKISQSSKPNFSSLLSDMMPPGSTFTMTDLNTGKTQSTSINLNKAEALEKMNKMLFDALKNNENLDDLSNFELEEKLADAIKKDDFEKASEISAVLRKRKNSDSDSEENLK